MKNDKESVQAVLKSYERLGSLNKTQCLLKWGKNNKERPSFCKRISECTNPSAREWGSEEKAILIKKKQLGPEWSKAYKTHTLLLSD